MDQAHGEVMLTLKVAVLMQAGTPRSEIARRLHITAQALARAIERLAAIAEQIDR